MTTEQAGKDRTTNDEIDVEAADVKCSLRLLYATRLT
jgi:hypothetical protein